MSRAGYRSLLHRYSHYAGNYDFRYRRYSEGTLGKALELIPDVTGDLLDVACGTGLFEVKLRQFRPRWRLTGVDISPEMLAKARARFAGDSCVRFEQSAAERLPVDMAAFDLIACNNAFHLVQDAPGALREFRRVLREDGTLAIIDWCRDAPQMRAMAAALRVSDRQVRRIRTINALCGLLEEHAFTITHRERFRVPPMWGLMAVCATKSDRDKQGEP